MAFFYLVPSLGPFGILSKKREPAIFGPPPPARMTSVLSFAGSKNKQARDKVRQPVDVPRVAPTNLRLLARPIGASAMYIHIYLTLLDLL